MFKGREIGLASRDFSRPASVARVPISALTFVLHITYPGSFAVVRERMWRTLRMWSCLIVHVSERCNLVCLSMLPVLKRDV